jgi:hypothetical protein
VAVAATAPLREPRASVGCRPGFRGPDPGWWRSWRRFLPLAFLLLLLFPGPIYVGFAANTAREMRIQSALQSSQAMAQLSARMLDRQCNAAAAVVQALAVRPGLAGALAGGNAVAVRQQLRAATDLVPDLLLAAAYSPDGYLVTELPPRRRGRRPTAARAEPAEAALPAGAPVRAGRASPSPAAGRGRRCWRSPRRSASRAAAVPPRSADCSANSGCATWRKGTAKDERPAPAGPRSTSSTDPAVSSSPRPAAAAWPARNWPRYSRRRAAGDPGAARVTLSSVKGGRGIVGYAAAAVPGWVVLDVRPEADALASTNYLLDRLALLLLPFLALTAAGARLLTTFHQNRVEMAEMLERQNEQLRAVDRAKSDFLANVSHDLRTPLASIQVSLSSLLDPSVSLSEGHARECLHVATEELEQLNTRVRNLLEMSRIEAQAYPLHRTPSDLTDIVAGALERLEPVTRGRPIRADFRPRR